MGQKDAPNTCLGRIEVVFAIAVVRIVVASEVG